MDESVFRLLNGLGVSFAALLSSKWMLVVVGLPLLGYWTRRKQWRAVLTVVMSLALSDLVVVRIMKPTVNRERPCHVLKEVQAPLGCGPGKSFPSAHASNAFALAISAAPNIPYGYYVLMPVAVGVSWSRISLGVHYPSDVLFGAFTGSLLAVLCGLLVFKNAKRRRFDHSSLPTE
jgi:undecaprenyl-diphosphatase